MRGTNRGMSRAKVPYVRVHVCPICNREFGTVAPHRNCCSAACRRRRLKLLRAIAASSSVTDDLLVQQLAALHERPVAAVRRIYRATMGTNRLSTDFKALAAEKWFGYGRWSAPYWFVGMEPGGADNPLVYSAWRDLGAPELLEIVSQGVVYESDSGEVPFSAIDDR